MNKISKVQIRFGESLVDKALESQGIIRKIAVVGPTGIWTPYNPRILGGD